MWNVHPRNKPLDAIAFLDLKEDMQEQFEKYSSLKRCHVVKDGQLGAERGSVFLEFEDAAEASKAFDSLEGRKYAGRKILHAWISESLYREHLKL